MGAEAAEVEAEARRTPRLDLMRVAQIIVLSTTTITAQGSTGRATPSRGAPLTSQPW